MIKWETVSRLYAVRARVRPVWPLLGSRARYLGRVVRIWPLEIHWTEEEGMSPEAVEAFPDLPEPRVPPFVRAIIAIDASAWNASMERIVGDVAAFANRLTAMLPPDQRAEILPPRWIALTTEEALEHHSPDASPDGPDGEPHV